MKNKLTTIVTGFALVLGVASTLVPVSSAGAIDVFSGAQCTGGTSSASKGGEKICGAQGDKLPDLIKNVINLLLFVVGIIAVIAIIIGGIRYTTSNGDSSQTKAAKDTILYAVIGLVVAIMAFAIVNFVVTAFS